MFIQGLATMHDPAYKMRAQVNRWGDLQQLFNLPMGLITECLHSGATWLHVHLQYVITIMTK
jgi:hypothetical protein